MEYNFSQANIPSNHSLQADFATGWKPKLKIIGPMPLNFDNKYLDKTVKSISNSDTSIYAVVYLGPRPANTFQMHEMLAKRYKYKYGYLLHSDFGHLKAFFHKFYSQFESETKRAFIGMNPKLKKNGLLFDSCFQSGNLDCAIRIKENQYDLVLRIDSNTAGHVMWYNFKVKNQEKHARTIKFNIINLRKTRSAYERGLKPYVKRKGEWAQEGEDLSVSEQRIRFNKENLLLSTLNQNYEADNTLFRKLTFELFFEAEEKLQLAYSIPYTYSQLMHDIRHFKEKSQKLTNISLEIDNSNESLSGLQIPIIKITNEQPVDEPKGNPQKKKFCVLIIGRQHPGESNGSYVVRGIINELLSENREYKRLRQFCTFVFIPMLNPDGVVMGNFRTSLYGKDLNRMFKANDTSMIPEIQFSRHLLYDLNKIHRNKFLLFLDIHGHSTRKNSFCFGPGILDAQIMSDIRYFPKIIASKTQIFRYPSCSFRINNDKKTTARALFSRYVGVSYTIETSNWAYFSKKENVDVLFTAELCMNMGQYITEAMMDYVGEKVDHLAKRKKREETKLELKKNIKHSDSTNNMKIKNVLNMRKDVPRIFSRRQLRSITEKQEKKKQKEKEKLKTQTEQKQSEKDRYNGMEYIEEREDENQSDKMSQDGMDTDSEKQDMNKEKFKDYINSASKMLIEFEKAYYGQHYKRVGQVKKSKLGNIFSRNKNASIKEKKKIELQPCLRKKEVVSLDLKQELISKKIIPDKKNYMMVDKQDRIEVKEEKIFEIRGWSKNVEVNLDSYEQETEEQQISPKQQSPFQPNKKNHILHPVKSSFELQKQFSNSKIIQNNAIFKVKNNVLSNEKQSSPVVNTQTNRYEQREYKIAGVQNFNIDYYDNPSVYRPIFKDLVEKVTIIPFPKIRQPKNTQLKTISHEKNTLSQSQKHVTDIVRTSNLNRNSYNPYNAIKLKQKQKEHKLREVISLQGDLNKNSRVNIVRFGKM